MLYKTRVKDQHLDVLRAIERNLCRLQNERQGGTFPDAYYEALADRTRYVLQLEMEYSDEAGFPVVFNNVADEMWEDYTRIDDVVVSIRELRHAVDLLKPKGAFEQLVWLIEKNLAERNR